MQDVVVIDFLYDLWLHLKVLLQNEGTLHTKKVVCGLLCEGFTSCKHHIFYFFSLLFICYWIRSVLAKQQTSVCFPASPSLFKPAWYKGQGISPRVQQDSWLLNSLKPPCRRISRGLLTERVGTYKHMGPWMKCVCIATHRREWRRGTFKLT